MFQKWFDVDVLEFQVELLYGYFGLQTILATFEKKMANCFSNLLWPVL
jgi:hypothetical protein